VTPPETSALTTELANLRSDIGNFGRDLSDIKSACAVLVERSNRTEQDVRDLRRELEDEVRKVREDEVKPLIARVEAMAARQWPLQSVAALASVSAVGLAVWQAVGR
jgi:regulator of replication initiation timing